ncbi:hypothetical protein SCODD09_00623 [Streptococcus constellatus]|nr:hypothetical protein SCODD09_00623 [Streptococcus constellatus]
MEWEKRQKFSIRKLAVGVASVLVGQLFVGTTLQDQVAEADSHRASTTEVLTEKEATATTNADSVLSTENNQEILTTSAAPSETGTTSTENQAVAETARDSATSENPVSSASEDKAVEQPVTVESSQSPSAPVTAVEKDSTPVANKETQSQPKNAETVSRSPKAPVEKEKNKPSSGVQTSPTGSDLIPPSTYDLDIRSQTESENTKKTNQIAEKLLSLAKEHQPAVEQKSSVTHRIKSSEDNKYDFGYTIIEDVDGKLKYREGILGLEKPVDYNNNNNNPWALPKNVTDAEEAKPNGYSFYNNKEFKEVTSDVAAKLAKSNVKIYVITKDQVQKYIDGDKKYTRTYTFGELYEFNTTNDNVDEDLPLKKKENGDNSGIAFNFKSESLKETETTPTEVAKKIWSGVQHNPTAKIRPVVTKGHGDEDKYEAFTFETWDKESYALDLLQDKSKNKIEYGHLGYEKVDYDTRREDGTLAKVYYRVYRRTVKNELDGKRTTVEEDSNDPDKTHTYPVLNKDERHFITYKLEWVDEKPNPLMAKGEKKDYKYKIVAYHDGKQKVYETEIKTVTLEGWDMISKDSQSNQYKGATYKQVSSAAIPEQYHTGHALNVETQADGIIKGGLGGHWNQSGRWEPHGHDSTSSLLAQAGLQIEQDAQSFKDYSGESYELTNKTKQPYAYEAVVRQVPFETEIHENKNLPKGTRNIIKFGETGEDNVTYAYDRDHAYYGKEHFFEYFAKEISRKRLKDPVKAIVEVGTQEVTTEKETVTRKFLTQQSMNLTILCHTVPKPRHKKVKMANGRLFITNG